MLLCFLFLSKGIPKAEWDAKQKIRENETKKRELHELLYSKIVKSGNIIRLASGHILHDYYTHNMWQTLFFKNTQGDKMHGNTP